MAKPLDLLKKADEALGREIGRKEFERKKRLDEERSKELDDERSYLVAAMGAELVDMVEPLLDKITESHRITFEELRRVIQEVKVDVKVDTPKAEVHVSHDPITIPEIKTEGMAKSLADSIAGAFAKLKFPKSEVTVKSPEIKFPEFPKQELSFPENMKMELGGVDSKHPLPVQVMGVDGKPFSFSGPSGGGGGKSDYLTIKDIRASTVSIIDQDAAAMRIVGSLSTSPFATYYASDAVASTNVIQLGGIDIALGSGVSSPGTMRVVHATDVALSTSVVSALPAGTNNIGDVDVLTLPVSFGAGVDNVTTQRVVHVSDVAISTVATGNVASGAADSGNPVKVGARVESSSIGEEADGDRVDLLADTFGQLLVTPGSSLSVGTLDKTATAAAAVVAAPGAGKRIRIRGFSISSEGTEVVTARIRATIGTVDTIVFHQSTDDQVGSVVMLPGFIDGDTNTAVNAELSGTSTNGVLFTVYYQTITV